MMRKRYIAALWCIIFYTLAQSASAAEYELDLDLTDKYLTDVSYKPKISESDKISIRFYGSERSYFAYFPNTHATEMPVLIALHGAGRTGASMIDTWAKSADKNSFVVVAPNGLNNNWDMRVDDAFFISAVVNDALAKRHIKNSGTYLFGHSRGAMQAIALAVRHPDMFRGVAVHAGTLPYTANNQVEPNKTSQTRVAIFLGDSDHLFTIESGRQTARWLASLGIDSTLYVLKDHTHWYYSDANVINERVWAFLKGAP